MTDRPRIAVIGAGPVGLDAVLAALDRGFDVTVFEAGPTVAHNVRSWGHVRLFSPWSMDVSPRMRRRLEAAGHDVPDDNEACPTGDELVARVLEPVAALPDVADALRLETRVLGVGRQGMLKDDAIGAAERGEPPFRLVVEGPDGAERVETADVVLDCSGSYGHPNRLGDAGVPAPGERALEERIVRTIPDVEAEGDEWAGRTTLLVGAGHSAWTAARDLAGLAEERPGTEVLWAVRGYGPGPGYDADDPLPARAELATRAAALARGASDAVELRPRVVVDALEAEGDRVRVTLRSPDGSRDDVVVDRVLSLTGYVGDASLYRQLQVHECYATSGPMKLSASLLAAGSADCLTQESHGVETLRSPEPDFYILGMKSYGRNNTFLLRQGWQQVEEVFEALEAETGVGVGA